MMFQRRTTTTMDAGVAKSHSAPLYVWVRALRLAFTALNCCTSALSVFFCLISEGAATDGARDRRFMHLFREHIIAAASFDGYVSLGSDSRWHTGSYPGLRICLQLLLGGMEFVTAWPS